jgi:hypothetical protein
MDTLARADAFLAQVWRGTPRQRERLLARMPLDDVQFAALHHPDAQARFWFLFYLDHYANDASMAVFAAGLTDPSVQVRGMALHSIACETCKSEELCVPDVVGGLVAVLERDPVAELRIKAIPMLVQLDDPRVRPALERSATKDPDPVVRHVAAEALEGRVVLPRKRYERSQRRHAKYHASRSS